MLKLIIGAVISAVVMMAWGFVFWVNLPFAARTMSELPAVDQVKPILKENVTANGVYLIPGMQPSPDADKETRAGFDALVKEGPVAKVIFKTHGRGMDDPTMYIQGLAHYFAVAFIGGIILFAAASPTYMSRVMLVFWVGVFSVVLCKVANVIWWWHPWDYALMEMGFNLVGCILMGLVMAAFVKPPVEVV